MKALLLSGGTGTRLRPFTYSGAKQLLPVANKPILHYALEAMAAAGIRQCVVVLGGTGQAVREALGDGDRFGLELTYVEQDAPRGLAHAVAVARPTLGDGPFVMVLGDNLLQEGVQPLVERFRTARAEGPGGARAVVALGRTDEPSRYGVAVVREGRVERLVEKPREPISNLALVGAYAFDGTIHEAIEGLAPSGRGEMEITDAIQRLLEMGHRVEPHVVAGWWKDTGQPADWLAANRLVLAALGRDVVLGEGAQVVDSTLEGPAVVGAGVRVVGSYVGPYTALGDGAVVRGSRIENSIVLEGALIEGVAGLVEGSLIGRRARVSGGGPVVGAPAAPAAAGAGPRVLRLLLGDDAEVMVQ